MVGLAAPDLRLFVVHPHLSVDRWKPTSGPLIAEADVVVVNRPGGEGRPPDPGVLSAVERFRGGRPVHVADVTRPLAEWAPELKAGLDGLR